jgi:hypothetical protein
MLHRHLILCHTVVEVLVRCTFIKVIQYHHHHQQQHNLHQ